MFFFPNLERLSDYELITQATECSNMNLTSVIIPYANGSSPQNIDNTYSICYETCLNKVAYQNGKA